MRMFCLLLAAAFTTTVSLAQEIKNIEVILNPSLQEEGELAYSGNPITWNEFKGAPDHSCGYTAMTYSGIKMKYSYATRKGIHSARVEVCPYMDISRSWYKKEGYNDPTLAHEQRHFDITAIITRQFIEDLKGRSFQLATFSSELRKLHQEYLHKLAQMQEQYDGETDHGVKPDKQAAWNTLLADEVRKAIAEG